LKSQAELFNEARARIKEVTPQETMAMRDADPSVVLLDCREPMETNLGYIPGATIIPLGDLEARVESAVPHDATVVIYCRSGNRSVFGADLMQHLGYTKVASMSSGIRGWVDAGGELEG
jgi:rhodanese-related sulfurtransferase